ncbi:MAG TPA: peptide ABC transporter substrate-binding protein [Candidatus Limnocylindrales bacterium]|nr:peptide ABC transporter substrate-binding protein [Candidatus Limnocylindrales bacterium]
MSLGAEDPDTLDPSKASTSTDIGVLHALNRGLIYFDKDLNPVPSLATALPTISADGLTYTFTLRDDAKYSNGDPIVAGDLVYAWKRIIDPRTASTYQAFYSDVKGGDEILALTGKKPAATDAEIDAALDKYGVSAPDDKTFVITLAHPAGYFLDIVGLWGAGPIQKKWVETPNFTEAANYVSSGPFMMKDWTHQASITLVPNPNWYGQKPTLTEIDFKIGGDPTADQATFEAGQLDMLAASPPDVPRIKADATLGPMVTTQPVLVTDYWGFNTADGPTANVHLRRALSMAIDKDTMLTTVYGGQGEVADSLIPPGMPGHQEGIGLKYDTAGAQTELAQALTELGYKTAADVPPLSFGFNTNAGHELPSAYMQNQWRTVLGIQSTLVGETFDQFLVDRPAGKFSIARNAWGADYPHPDNWLRALFQSQSGNNDSKYKNPQYDDLVAKAGAEPDLDKSIALYNQAQELLVQDAPAVFTRWRVSNYEVEPYVQGVQGTAQDSVVIGDYFYENISIAQH